MGAVLSAGDVLEMAQRIEENGARFYRKAAEQAEGPARDLLLALAEDEDEHRDTFAAMRRDLAQREDIAATFDPDDQAVRYLQSIADGHVFDLADPSQEIRGDEPLDDILARALESEKDSIVFYLGLRDLMPEALGRGRLEAVIAEEMRHITRLGERRAAGAA